MTESKMIMLFSYLHAHSLFQMGCLVEQLRKKGVLDLEEYKTQVIDEWPKHEKRHMAAALRLVESFRKQLENVSDDADIDTIIDVLLWPVDPEDPSM